MLRLVVGRLGSSVRNATATRATTVAIQSCRNVHGFSESDEELDARYIKFFSRPDIDHWEARKAINELAGIDMVPEPSIICEVLKACRRLNDFAMAVRFLECIKDKCGNKVSTIYPYILQEIRPTLDELGINTPEELGYDKPELALQDPDDM